MWQNSSRVFGFKLALLLVLLSTSRSLRAATAISLDGSGWSFHGTLDETHHPVSVPHCWMVMNGYENYIGDAIYERNFDAPVVASGQIVRLHFDAVYYKARIWLNGQDLGSHEGGYTPFEFDITKLLRTGTNHLVVEVDNTPTLTTIPAIATAGHGGANPTPFGTLNGEGIVGWMPYGGIVRPVSLLVTRSVYLKNFKVEAKPDFAAHTAVITVRATVGNAGETDAKIDVTGEIANLAVRTPRLKST